MLPKGLVEDRLGVEAAVVGDAQNIHVGESRVAEPALGLFDPETVDVIVKGRSDAEVEDLGNLIRFEAERSRQILEPEAGLKIGPLFLDEFAKLDRPFGQFGMGEEDRSFGALGAGHHRWRPLLWKPGPTKFTSQPTSGSHQQYTGEKSRKKYSEGKAQCAANLAFRRRGVVGIKYFGRPAL
ncbi:MAG TPA: hypothetical protein VJR29_11625 [bacterium]|nr:hypothetical protein [bacterium]